MSGTDPMTDFTDLSPVVIDGYAESSSQGRMLGSFTEMPTPTANHLGSIVLYTGTTGTYVNGQFYQCISTGSAYQWSPVIISGTEEETYQADRVMVTNGAGTPTVSPVSSTELSYLGGVTSGVQLQLNAKQNANIGTASRAVVSDSSGKLTVSDVTSTEIGHLDGVTSNIQTQLNSKQATVTGGASTIVSSNLTTNRVLVSNTSGKVSASDITTTELNFLDGVTSAIQSQLDGLRSQIDAIGNFSVQVVDNLPESGNANTIYFIPSGGNGENVKDEYMWINNAWEQIGSTEFNLQIQQNSSGINVNGTALQDANASQDGLMTQSHVNLLNSVNSGLTNLNNEVDGISSEIDDLGSRLSSAESTLSTTVSRVDTLEEELVSQTSVINVTVTSSTGNINGLSVKAVPNSGNTITGTTNSSGQCALQVRAGYQYTVSVVAPTNYNTPASQQVTPVAGSGSSVNFTMTRKPLVNITVIDSSSSGYQNGRTVQASGSGGTQTATTNNGGTAALYLNGTGNYTLQITNLPEGGSADSVTINAANDGTYSANFNITFGWTYSLILNSSAMTTDPTGCFTYGDDAVGFTPVSNTSTSLAKATTEGNWAFDPETGMDIEGCFYATFQSGSSGQYLHQLLNPYNLDQYIATWDDSAKEWDYDNTGTSSIGSENTMLCIPTIYRKGSSGKLVHSSKASAGTAYAHTIGGHTYEYLGLGVYLAYNSSSTLYSRSGVSATVNTSLANFRTYAGNNDVRNGHGMMWNFHQWELWKEMVYMRLKSFNGQARCGQGGQSYGSPTTGLCDALGPFAGNVSGTSNAVKCLIENGWGCLYQYIDDCYYSSSGKFVVGQNAVPTSNTSNKPISVSTWTTNGFPGSIKQSDVGWSMAAGSGGSSSTGTCDYFYPLSSSLPFAYVGDRSGGVSGGLAGPGYCNAALGGGDALSGSRLAFVFDL